jgi:tRNA(fMet)-specific endonuclease VapC
VEIDAETYFMLDTNICIYLINNRPLKVKEIFNQHQDHRIALSSVVVFELHYGIEKSTAKAKNQIALEAFLSGFEIEPFSQAAAAQAANIRATLEKAGTPIGAYDCLIAAHALERGAVLVTNNIKEFQQVERLKLENWFA